MKRVTSATAGLLLTLAVLAVSGAFAGTAATADPERGAGHAYGFERFLQRYEAANTAFVNGNPSPWLSITAEKDPASIFGGFGGLGEAGVASVHERYLLAAPRLTSSTGSRTCGARWPTRSPSSAQRSCTPGTPNSSRRSCGPR